ncbi:putative phage portal protein, SPP1 family [Hoylesella buccalis ATCC 35310]|uniref:Putative phage portal protein, SPP1 family n=1 Tax=Hoylesella buccalis ATCC 35310 TaxID=679190 RepID=D1W5P0_9BACT|nr:phage portal protein [Hoylesella buccalis]EFA92137.1 putative phage portal protein, SPP1 family [Hoylesella buccalis ATCC 35310]
METPKTLDEILALEDIDQKIAYLKKGRRTSQPDTDKNLADWNPKLHDIMKPEIYPKIKVLVKMEDVKFDPETGKSIKTPAKYEMKEPNRIALPIEQDIVNIHTAFTVGMEPSLDCQPEDDKERSVFESVKQVFKKDKLKYQNRKIVRSWLSEQEVAEYWYVVKDDSFWTKLKRKIAGVFGKTLPEYRLKSQIWSPFRGDKLYPFYDNNGDMVAFSREYKTKDLDGNTHPVFMTITDTMVFQWNMDKTWEANTERTFKHGFKKIPVIYTFRSETLCKKIKPQRGRLEKTLSSYADCLDNHYFPMLMLFGDIQPDLITGDARNRMMNLTGDGANAQYLTWNQSSDPIKVEIETYFNQIYGLTNTPRISFDQLKGVGNALSGTAFRYVFMAAHMAVQNHAEELGSFFQRRVNFLTSAIGALNTSLEEASHTVDIETEIVPFMIDSESDKVTTAVAAVSGGVWSLEHGIAYCSNYGELQDELQQIREEQKEKAQQQTKPAEPKERQL